MKLFKVAATAILPFVLAACPGKKEEAPAPAPTEMVPSTPPAGEEAAPAQDPNAAPGNPSQVEGGTSK